MNRLILFLLLAMPLSAAQPILILGAVPQEIVPVVAALQDHRQTTIAGIPCDTGTLGGHEVVVALTGVGKTNSAMTTTALVVALNPSKAFMTGTAARIRRTIRTGDIIIASVTSFHDAGSLTAEGMVQGKLADDGTLVATMWFSPTRDRTNPFVFPDSPELVAYAEKEAAGYTPEPVTLDGATYQPVIRTGTVASGDLSGVTEVKIADIRAKINPDLMEMESASFAQVCQFYKVPHLVIRSGSNWAKEHNNDDYLRLSPIAARQAALFTVVLVRNLP
jgi:adenosylhomocysteine nucleosidase/futalosine hydrolase